jgi:diacylglycerol kinase family enzyme
VAPTDRSLRRRPVTLGVVRALLVVNPKATGTTPRSRDVLAAALTSDLKVEVVETQARGHATELARQAVEDRVDYVVALGGDGTLNEVVNGLLAEGPSADVPTLGIVPGGCANVLARSLGLPTDPIEATAVLLTGVRAGRHRTISLGRADERWFTFCAGLGIDAATVRRVEAARHGAKQVTSWQYARAAVVEYFLHLDHGQAPLTVSRPGHDDAEVFLGLVCNTSPWTYLGERPVTPCPEASFDTGLDMFGLTAMRPLPTLRIVSQLFRSGPHGRRVLALHDEAEITVRATEPTALQVDGDFLGEATEVTLRSVPRALRVVDAG